MGQGKWFVRMEKKWSRGGETGQLERDDDRGGDNEAGEDSSRRYKSDYGNEDDSNAGGVDHQDSRCW